MIDGYMCVMRKTGVPVLNHEEFDSGEYVLAATRNQRVDSSGSTSTSVSKNA